MQHKYIKLKCAGSEGTVKGGGISERGNDFASLLTPGRLHACFCCLRLSI